MTEIIETNGHALATVPEPELKDPTNEEVKRRKLTELYMALKLASDLSGKCHFYTYQLDKFKDAGKEASDYELNEMFKDLLTAEAHIEVTKKAFDVAKRELTAAMTVKILEQFR